MINLNELRIGNYVSALGMATHKVTYIDSENEYIACEEFSERPISEFEPILLTEEWLVKLGFDLINEGYLCLDCGISVNFKFKKDGSLLKGQIMQMRFGVGYTNSRNDRIKYVHQLQNLFFALTGEELTIK